MGHTAIVHIGLFTALRAVPAILMRVAKCRTSTTSMSQKFSLRQCRVLFFLLDVYLSNLFPDTPPKISGYSVLYILLMGSCPRVGSERNRANHRFPISDVKPGEVLLFRGLAQIHLALIHPSTFLQVDPDPWNHIGDSNCIENLPLTHVIYSSLPNCKQHPHRFSLITVRICYRSSATPSRYYKFRACHWPNARISYVVPSWNRNFF